ncbi:MAG: HAMP domain-containing histidine kinase, partial [Proteobacteria bacterium]|nr:HAMP domain-containing histidine kinase [Pseudomonadota bacterium]
IDSIMKSPKILNKVVGVTNLIGVKFFFLLVVLLMLSFGIVIYVNIYFLTSFSREDVVNNAVQVSNLIKRATYHSMLENRRDDLTNTILSIGKEKIFEGIRIYNKIGRISFSDRLEELGGFADKKAEQCYVCHAEEPAKGVVPTKDRTRILKAPKGYRILGLINPIENEPKCFNASCHAHSPKEKLLGILDVKLSLEEGDKKIIVTRNRMIIYSAILILISALVKGYFTRKMIHSPIKKLYRATKEVANLNLDHKVDINSRDEFGVLANSFNKMTGELKASTEELRKTQSRLILSEKMASLGKLSATVAHEINNPLSGILSYAKLSSKYLGQGNIDSGTFEIVNKNLGIISNEAKRCGDIVKNLLLFTKRTSGDFKAEHLNEIIDASIGVVGHSAEMNELKLIKELDDGDDYIQCDAGDIQQVLIALIINSIEDSTRGGKIIVRTDYHSDKDRTQIMIIDNGKGIPKDALPHIFEPFFSMKKSGKNIGLGLSVVYGIIKEHGGTIDVESKEREGTKFTITLPRLPAAKRDA